MHAASVQTLVYDTFSRDRKPVEPGREPKRLLVVDTHSVFCDGLRDALGRLLPDIVVSCVTSTEDIGFGPPVDFVFLSLRSVQLRSPEASVQITAIRSSWPRSSIVVFKDRVDGLERRWAAKLGLQGCVSYSLGIQDAIDGVRQILKGGSFFHGGQEADCDDGLDNPVGADPDDVRAGRDAPGSGDSPYFTPREREVIAQLRKGKPNKIIAYDLGMSVSTVKVHLRNIMRKLNASNRMQVVLTTSCEPR